MKPIPEIRKEHNRHTLYVDGKPFLAFAGETHNSSASSIPYLREKVWPFIRPLNLNTLVTPAYWELIEPREGEFDFSLIDGLLEELRKENLRVVLLWFGLWKNGESFYAPGWVKRDTARFARCVSDNETITPFCEAAVAADAKAFAALMRHLREVDGEDRTVIMVQVENEIGLLGRSRDRSSLAQAAYEAGVPEALAKATGRTGGWEEAFGGDGDEVFMAWRYANAIEQIAQAGKKEYPLPMYVNAWLQQDNHAGQYPSGGPVARMVPLYRFAAPSLSLCAPDVYVPQAEQVMREFTAGDNALFIPEFSNNVTSAAAAFLAFGQYDALGFAPFAIEDIFGKPAGPANEDALLGALSIDRSSFDTAGTGEYLPQAYRLLAGMMGLLCEYRGTGKMQGFYQYHNRGCVLSFKHYDVRVSYRSEQRGKPPAGGLVIETAEDHFIFAGTNFDADIVPKLGEACRVDYVTIEEGEFIDDVWQKGRTLNGDEQWISIGAAPQVLKVEVYRYDA